MSDTFCETIMAVVHSIKTVSDQSAHLDIYFSHSDNASIANTITNLTAFTKCLIEN